MASNLVSSYIKKNRDRNLIWISIPPQKNPENNSKKGGKGTMNEERGKTFVFLCKLTGK